MTNWLSLAERFQALADRPVHHVYVPATGEAVPNRSCEHDAGYRLMGELCRAMATSTITDPSHSHAYGIHSQCGTDCALMNGPCGRVHCPWGTPENPR